MTQEKILLIDSDQESRKALENDLKKKGYTVLSLNETKDAIMTAIGLRPDLVVSRAKMPVIDGQELSKLMRQNYLTSNIPFLFIHDEASEMKGLKDNMDEEILIPFSVDDMTKKIDRILKISAERKTLLSRRPRKISGQLGIMNLADIIQILDMNRKSCVVTLKKEKTTGRVYFRNGRIIDAEIGKLQGEEALLELLGWKEADFIVETDIDLPFEDRIKKDTSTLLIEAFTRIDENGVRTQANSNISDEDKRGLLAKLKELGVLREI